MANRQMIVYLLALFVSSSHQGNSTCQCNCSCTKDTPLIQQGRPGWYIPETPLPQPGRPECYKPRDCQDIKQCRPKEETGMFTIYPKGTNGIRVRCDMDIADGGWTVIQRRISSSDFYKTWAEYQTGFGDLNASFWLGNYLIHLITSQSWYELRIDMTGPAGHTRYAHYDLFAVADGFNKYQLMVGRYNGTAGDNLKVHNGHPFSTKDADNDAHGNNCAVAYHGGWWYKACHQSNLNGQYGNNEYGKGINWHAFTTYKKSLTKADMKIRRHPLRPAPYHLLP